MKKDLFFSLLKGSVKTGMILLLAFLISPAFGQYGDNMLTNGDFESGNTDGWDIYNGKTSESTISITSDAYAGDHAILVDVTALGTKISHTYLRTNPNLTITTDKTYRIICWAKSATAGSHMKIHVQMYDADGTKKNAGSQVFNLTTEYKQYVYFFYPRHGFDEIMVRFQIGDNIDKYYFDNISVQPVENIANGGFEEGVTMGWKLDTLADHGIVASLTEETDDPFAGTISAKVNITTSDDTASHVKLTSLTRIYADPAYKQIVKFTAKGSVAGDSLYIGIPCYYYDTANLKNAFAFNIMDSVALDPDDYATYTLPFTLADTINSISLRFWGGQNTSSYVVDEVSIQEYIPPAITAIPNDSVYVDSTYSYQVSYEGWGTFSLVTDPAADWLSIDQFGVITGTPTTPDTVTVSVILNNGTDADTTQFTLVVMETPTGVNDILSGDEPLFYPNPAHGIIYLNAEPGAVVRIMDITGKTVVDQRITQPRQALDISRLTKGLYLVKCEYEHKTVVRKMIVR